jgi:hypothetical protein
MLFVCERGRSRRVPSAICSERSEQLNTGSRADVLRRREGDMLFVCERRRSSRLQSAIRAERAQRAEQSKWSV